MNIAHYEQLVTKVTSGIKLRHIGHRINHPDFQNFTQHSRVAPYKVYLIPSVNP